METSTPISGRREINLIELEDDSPIGNNAQSSSCASDVSSEVIPTSKTKAGISDQTMLMAWKLLHQRKTPQTLETGSWRSIVWILLGQL